MYVTVVEGEGQMEPTPVPVILPPFVKLGAPV